jgi:hypothetical protein
MNTPPLPKSEQEKEKVRAIPTASAVLPDGELVELVYDPVEHATQFVRGAGEAWSYAAAIDTRPGERLVPYSPANNLLVHDVVLLPSGPEEYGTEPELLARIREFIHRYVDVSPVFEELSAYYVLLSWLYDCFHELPYLRVRGDYGSGKTRFLLVVGALCYKPIFASGASTTSPLFRIIDAFRGTLILDESDFRLSDERAEIVKILNNGNAKGFPVLRTEVNRSKEFDPRAYTVFGPKLVATRGYFEDRALESRCLTEDMGQQRLREGVPLNLDDRYREEARELRNQLLLFRLKHWTRSRELILLPERGIEPRLRQIFAPFLSLIDDPEAHRRALDLLRAYQRDLVSDRALALEARILESIKALLTPETTTLRIQDITAELLARFGEDFERPVTPKWVSSTLRRRLSLKPVQSKGVFVLGPGELAKVPQLLEKYGLGVENEEPTETAPASPVMDDGSAPEALPASP